MTEPVGAVRALIDFAAAQAGGERLRCAFERPLEVLTAHAPAQVRPLLDAAEAHATAGRWCVLWLRYEAAPAFDAAFETHPADGPLATAAVFDRALPWPGDGDAALAALHWHDPLPRAAFDARIAAIHRAIADGEVYQINLTSPTASAFDGEPRALFAALQRAQPGGYAAFIDAGDEQLLSVSPELFFDRRGDRLLARPMKGTAPRGIDAQDDAAQGARLAASEKERAENLMIVDLLRNDLSRVAVPHSVRVPALFERQALPTVWQMTSDVTATARPGTSLAEVFGALFPCGSVTGAPKVRAMHWIRRLEDGPRGVYCGAIGVLRPGGDATFNVPIRTVSLRGGRAVCGIGSAVTADADAAGEWREWRHKRAFLERAARPFELLETFRLEDGRFVALDLHLARLQRAARHFSHSFDQHDIDGQLAALAASHGQGRWRVRLLLAADGALQLQAFPLEASPAEVTVQLALSPIAADSEFVRFKTTRREAYDAFAPTTPGVYDTLLWNEAGELTEFTRGTLAAQREDGRWVTPPLACGLLDGVGRAQALQAGRLEEAVLRVDDLPRLRALAFVNSLRGWLPARLAP